MNKFIIFIFLSISLMGCEEFFREPTCTKSSKVISIDSIIYRGGMVTLENGMSVNVGQPHKEIKIGTDICLESRLYNE
jgi:hypothetical protein